MADYMPTSEKDVEGMYQELLSYVKKIENKYLRQLAEEFYVKNQEFIKIFIHLAVLGLSCEMQNLSLQRVGFF